MQSSRDRRRKDDYRNNPDAFELPAPVKPGVSVIRSYRPVQKVTNTDGKQRMRTAATIPAMAKGSTQTAGSPPGRLRKLTINEILATPGTPVVYLTNRFGSAKVVLDEHQYVYHFAAKGVSYYRCDQFKRNQCPAQILVVGGMTHAVNVVHTHPIDTHTQEPEHLTKKSPDGTRTSTTSSNTTTPHCSTILKKQPTSMSGRRETSTNTTPITPTKQATKHVLNFSEITKGKPVEMSILPTRKGAAGVLCHGHHFEFRYSRQQHKVFRCAWHATHSCQAQVLLHNKLFYIIHDKHTHIESSKLHPDILGKTSLKTQ
uniref:FLYWCH-type domain-containing protein n=1 Tax=Anopheles christyi TaxID=43041 RepID=A0A182JNL0_9DIPT